MNSAKQFSLEYLTLHREGAVAVLEKLDPIDAAAYLKDVPDEVVRDALEVMQPIVAAAILSDLPHKKIANAMLAMDNHSRSQIMRVLGDEQLKSILAQMPKKAARDLTKFLEYPEGTVGASMSSNVPVYEPATKVGDCFEHLRALPEKIRNAVFVVDAQRKFVGAVELADFFLAADDIEIGTIADKSIKCLSPYDRLTSIVALTAWDAALSLPVIDTKGRFLGTLHFDHLRTGLAAERYVAPEQHLGEILAHLAEAFLVCALGLLDSSSRKPTLSRPTIAGGNRDG